MISKEEETYLHELEKAGIRDGIIKQLREAFERGISIVQMECEKEVPLEEQIERTRTICEHRKQRDKEPAIANDTTDRNKKDRSCMEEDGLER